jgi:hypothetical protein
MAAGAWITVSAVASACGVSGVQINAWLLRQAFRT